jgi:hypothetical protein
MDDVSAAVVLSIKRRRVAAYSVKFFAMALSIRPASAKHAR